MHAVYFHTYRQNTHAYKNKKIKSYKKDVWEQFGGVSKTSSFCSYVGETRRRIGVSVEEGDRLPTESLRPVTDVGK